jgi:PEP-CTERM motif
MRLFKVLSVVLFAPILAHADTLSITGNLNPSNPNDVFLSTITLAVTSNLTIQTWSYGGTANASGGTNAAGMVIPSGGFDTYLSLFQGSGSSATFLASNDDSGCDPAAPGPTLCEDSRLDLTSLAAGDYTLALTLPFNYSFAENLASGTLGDGFIGLQGDYYDSGSDMVRTSAFAVDITRKPSESSTPPAPTPEPSSLVLLATGLAASFAPLRRRWRARSVL